MLLLTAAKCPAVMERPMASGADPLRSPLRSSQTPWTTNTRTKVIMASIISPCTASSAGLRFVLPKLPLRMVSGVANCEKVRE